MWSAGSLDYEPIADHGAIGNLRSVALVSKRGVIDWCCLPRVDGPSVFASLLDSAKGGKFSVAVYGAESWQEYLPGTNVLRTWMRASDCDVSITDFMPLEGSLEGRRRSRSRPEVHRLVECVRGQADVKVEWSPRLDYARGRTEINRDGRDGHWRASLGDSLLTLTGFDEGRVVDLDGPSVVGAFHLSEGGSRALMTRWGEPDGSGEEHARRWLRSTTGSWTSWSSGGLLARDKAWAEPWSAMLERSELALKLMIHGITGAIIAAPTTSLPEVMGGSKNWDYRFTWLRDASMTAQALLFLGHDKEAMEFLGWLEEVTASPPGREWGPLIMYGVRGEIVHEDEALRHLEGYMRSRPVRVGNTAVGQRQHEVYGEVMNVGYELLRRGFRINGPGMSFLARCADHVCEIWDTPDSGIWESRETPKHYTYSKVMLWAALDRAYHMSVSYGLEGDADKWKRVSADIADAVLEKGYDEIQGTFVEYFGSTKLDAANLRIPVMEFLPFHDRRVQGTIDRTIERLTFRDLVYRNEHVDEEGREGAFGICTFWLVIDLALSDRLKEARRIFDGALKYTRNVGLLPEQIDPRSGDYLGNYPQAFTHIGLINAAMYLAYAEGRDIGPLAPMGTMRHRENMGRLHVEGRASEIKPA